MGAVIGREGGSAVCLTHRGVLFAATDRSHGGNGRWALKPWGWQVGAQTVGAVIGREGVSAVWLMQRSG